MVTLTVDDWALQKITLDTANQFIPDILIANTNDTLGRGIDLYITKDGTALSLSGMKVYLVWRHENGNQDVTQFTAVSAATGHYKVYYPNAMMHGGTVLARIAIYVGSKTPITGSRDFRINVEPNPIREDEAMADENFSIFQQVTIDLNELQASITAAESARASAESARASAESTRRSNENTRQANEAARSSAESSRSSAEATRVSAEAARVSNETTRVNAEQARESASGAAVSAAESAANRANAAAASVESVVLGSTATPTTAGIMSAADKAKLDGIEDNANAYVLPQAADSVLGGIKVGANFSIADDGTLNQMIDSTPTPGSTHAVSSGGTASALAELTAQVPVYAQEGNTPDETQCQRKPCLVVCADDSLWVVR